MTPGSKLLDTARRIAPPRDLTPVEQERLEISIERVRQMIVPLEADTINDMWSQLLTSARPEDLEGARTIGVALGTALLDAEPTARWVSCMGPNGWTPGVVSSAQAHSPVLVVYDTIARWKEQHVEWVDSYLTGAMDHLISRGGLGDEQPWIATPDDLDKPPAQIVRDLAITALELGLSLAGDEARAFAVLPGSGGPMSATAPGDPGDEDGVRAWARQWAEDSMSPYVAVAWVDPPRGAARHAAGRAGSVVVEANEAGMPGIVVAHEFTTDFNGTSSAGQPVILGQCEPLV